MHPRFAVLTCSWSPLKLQIIHDNICEFSHTWCKSNTEFLPLAFTGWNAQFQYSREERHEIWMWSLNMASWSPSSAQVTQCSVYGLWQGLQGPRSQQRSVHGLQCDITKQVLLETTWLSQLQQERHSSLKIAPESHDIVISNHPQTSYISWWCQSHIWQAQLPCEELPGERIWRMYPIRVSCIWLICIEQSPCITPFSASPCLWDAVKQISQLHRREFGSRSFPQPGKWGCCCYGTWEVCGPVVADTTAQPKAASFSRRTRHPKCCGTDGTSAAHTGEKLWADRVPRQMSISTSISDCQDDTETMKYPSYFLEVNPEAALSGTPPTYWSKYSPTILALFFLKQHGPVYAARNTELNAPGDCCWECRSSHSLLALTSTDSISPSSVFTEGSVMERVPGSQLLQCPAQLTTDFSR